MATLKNCHSPAGMCFTTADLRHVNLIDCPQCKHGTLDLKDNDTWLCADCKAAFPAELLRAMDVLSNSSDTWKKSTLSPD